MNDGRRIIRMRHETARRRTLTVREKRNLAPNYLSILFHCDDFADFNSAAADDHVKLFVPGQRGEGGKPPMRDYTPRAFDAAKGEFVIDFALHEDPGPATAWAIGAQAGDQIQIGGPRGSNVIPESFDWYWLIADETGIPAVMRRMAEWPAAKMRVVIAVPGPEEEVALPASANHTVEWVHRSADAGSDAAPLISALAAQELPAGDGFVWIAAEAGVAKELREKVLAMGQPLERIKAAGYWTAGMADTTARF